MYRLIGIILLLVTLFCLACSDYENDYLPNGYQYLDRDDKGSIKQESFYPTLGREMHYRTEARAGLSDNLYLGKYKRKSTAFSCLRHIIRLLFLDVFWDLFNPVGFIVFVLYIHVNIYNLHMIIYVKIFHSPIMYCYHNDYHHVEDHKWNTTQQENLSSK